MVVSRTRCIEALKRYSEHLKRVTETEEGKGSEMAGNATDAADAVRAATTEARRGAIQQAMAIRVARAHGMSWREIGQLFDISSQAAHNRWAEWCRDIDASELGLTKPRLKHDRWLSEAQVASMLNVDLTTFRVWKIKPKFTIANDGLAYYRQSDVIEWVSK